MRTNHYIKLASFLRILAGHAEGQDFVQNVRNTIAEEVPAEAHYCHKGNRKLFAGWSNSAWDMALVRATSMFMAHRQLLRRIWLDDQTDSEKEVFEVYMTQNNIERLTIWDVIYVMLFEIERHAKTMRDSLTQQRKETDCYQSISELNVSILSIAT